ncbi:putative B6 ABC transporter ATP-binding protein [Sodalis sp. RH21]|uniref:putative B6 ABC transporter ATP-binding protein n=1 Tax=unclassified Sodalis (in: enterobacteria) TaxID=2636512 RepID=UPI0039B4D393
MSQKIPDAPPALVTVSQVTKRFPGITANNRIDLSLRAGEVHVLLGENGAGKSTLVAMLAGLQQPDEGQIAVNGRAEVLRSPRRALELGIGTVFQHAMMVPGLSVVDNIALGDSWWRRPARRHYADRVRQIAGEIGVRVNPYALAGSLSLGEQQQAEIVRTLLRGSRVLILDEATAMLTPLDAHELGLLMRRLVARGLAVVFITHKLNEALDWGDRISVLRLGSKVGEIGPQRLKTLARGQATGEVIKLMFNLAPGADAGRACPPARSVRPADKPVLQIRALAVDDPLVPLAGIDLQIGAGEIVGIAGIDGNGQKQLAEALAGQRKLAGGDIVLDGAAIGRLSIGQRRKRGLRYVTDDRLGEGSVGAFPVALNLLLKQIGAAPFWRRGIEQPAAIARHALLRIHDYDIRTPAVDTPLGTLSGGNIQKILLARELGDQARVVIFAKPTYGLDVKNTRAIRDRIRQAALSGMAVLLISTDVEELLELAHRIAVMSRGHIVGIVDAAVKNEVEDAVEDGVAKVAEGITDGTAANDRSARSRIAALMSGVSQ